MKIDICATLNTILLFLSSNRNSSTAISIRTAIMSLNNSIRDITRTCEVCRKIQEDMKKCSKCKAVRYCSQDCQKKDWSYHKTICATKEQKKLIIDDILDVCRNMKIAKDAKISLQFIVNVQHTDNTMARWRKNGVADLNDGGIFCADIDNMERYLDNCLKSNRVVRDKVVERLKIMKEYDRYVDVVFIYIKEYNLFILKSDANEHLKKELPLELAESFTTFSYVTW